MSDTSLKLGVDESTCRRDVFIECLFPVPFNDFSRYMLCPRKCYITSCLDAREIPSDPSVVLQIGDLRSAAKAGVLASYQSSAAIASHGRSRKNVLGLEQGVHVQMHV